MRTRSVIVSILALVSILAFAGPASAAHRHHKKHHRHHRHHRRRAAAPTTPTPPARAPTAPAPTPVTQTPVTVANVCHLNSGLGQTHFVTSGGIPAAYWTYDTGALRLLTYSDDGDTAVDAAGAFGSDGTLTYVARCDWSVWVTVPPQAQTGSSTSIAGAVDFIWSANRFIDPITPDGPGCAGAGGIYGGTCTPG